MESNWPVKPARPFSNVAQANGIEIPNLCHDPRLRPAGACRLCLVEVAGQRGPVTACTFAIADGMVVQTNTDEIRALRKTVLELLFAEHRGVCTTCDKNGDCLLQKYGYEYQIADAAFTTPGPGEAVENYTTGNEAIRYRPEKCIRCGRCIRICQEVQMDSALTFKDRAAWVEVSTAFEMPLNDSTCELCGQCISTCPTGALYERAAEGKGQAKDLTRTRTTCVYCGVGCQIDLNVNGNNEIVRVTSPTGVVPNNGNLCVKGRFGMEFVKSDKRLTTPLIKRNGTFEKATWDEAIGARRRPAQGNQGGLRARQYRRALLGQVHERGELRLPEIHPGGGRHEQRGPLRQAVPRLDGRRPGQGVRLRRHDQLHRRDQARRMHLRHRLEHDRGASRDRPGHQGGGRPERRETHRGRPAGHRPGPLRRGAPGPQARHRRGADQRHDERDRVGEAAQRAVHPGADGGLRGAGRDDQGLHARKGGSNHDRPGRGDPPGGAPLRHHLARQHHLQHGDHPAHDRHGQRADPGEPRDADGQRGQGIGRRQSAAGTEQRAGRVRHGGPAQRVSGLPVGGRCPGTARNSSRRGAWTCRIARD